MRFCPAICDTGFGDQRYFQLQYRGSGLFHDAGNTDNRFFSLGFWYFKDKFIMHLQ